MATQPKTVTWQLPLNQTLPNGKPVPPLARIECSSCGFMAPSDVFEETHDCFGIKAQLRWLCECAIFTMG